MLIMTDSDSSSNSNIELLPQLFPQRRRARCGQDSRACLGPGPASAVMTWELWGPTDEMELYLHERGLVGWYREHSTWQVRRHQ